MDWDRWEELKADSRIWFASVLVLIVSIFLWAGLGVFSIAFCVLSLILGGQLAQWIAVDSNGQFLSNFIDTWVLSRTKCSIFNPKENELKNTKPWTDLELPPDLNKSLENLLNDLVTVYVAEWYSSGIGSDRAFLEEIHYQLRYASAKFVKFILQLDLPTVISKEVIPAASLHIHKVSEIWKNVPDKNSFHPSMAEDQIIEKMVDDLHYALRSRQSELNYLRQVADVMIPHFFDNSRVSGKALDDDFEVKGGATHAWRFWPSHAPGHFVRELLVNYVLLPVLDLIADPDTINTIIIGSLDSLAAKTNDYKIPNERVSFLRGLSENAEKLPDSLLQLKLSEILRDEKHFNVFRQYLLDIKGPVNELSFLVEATRIHESMQRKDESSSQISYDIWQLYGQFVHEGAPAQIPFDSHIVHDFKQTMPLNDMKEWDRIIEEAYQIVYQRLQVEYVIQFCQSDVFLGYLCGSPPVSVIELIDKPSKRNIRIDKIPTAYSVKSFVASKMRSLFSLSMEGSIEGEEVICEDFCPDSGLLSEMSFELEKSRSAVFDKVPSNELNSTLTLSSSTSLPTIDISEDSGVGGSDHIYNQESEDALSHNGSVDENASNLLIIDQATKNMNFWTVGISKVIPFKENTTGRTIFVYVIDVDRSDAQEHETKQWIVYRRYTEFYALESKLYEFHGANLKLNMLPSRKTFERKNREFMEQNRQVFSLFLSSLCKQTSLRRSDLVFAFLTSPDEFRESLMLSDLNPWKVVKKMPSKLSREKGQHLRPFLLNMLANTLSPPEDNYKEKVDVLSESSSMSSTSAAVDQANPSVYSSLFGNNCANMKFREEDLPTRQPWTQSPFDASMLLLHDALSQVPVWLGSIVSAIRLMFKSSFDGAVNSVFNLLFCKLYEGGSLLDQVQLLHETLFCSYKAPPSVQERVLRDQLMKQRLSEFIQENVPSCIARFVGRQSLRQAVDQITYCLQHPRLNKQLSYVLLDILLKHLLEVDKQSDCK
ncbi:unnamed protein product [Auanema sp. JU1783]|nr:unnamed protein product [Auanema sp. JU1783]